jgi:hypothetical protein
MSSLAVRHAWLQMSTLKRKADDEPPLPRKRIQTLENSMADMTLARSPRWPSSPNRHGVVTPVIDAVVDEPMDGLEAPQLTDDYAAPPSATQTLPQSEDVRMARQTWYELEKDRG